MSRGGERPPTAGALRRSRCLWPGVAVYAVARAPSFLEPHWYTDEAGYATTANAMAHGAALYSTIWSNKPPLHLWSLALPVAATGGAEPALHALTFLSGLVALAAVAHAARGTLGEVRAGVAVLLAACLLGPPLLDAELAVPEALLIAPISWAGAIAVRHAWGGGPPDTRAPARWPWVAGLLAAAAVAVQQTAIADAAALGLVLGLAPGVRPREVAAYAGVVVGATLAWLAAAAAWAGPGTVAFALAGFYVPYTQSVLPGTAGGLLRHLGTVAGATALVASGAALLRHGRGPFWAYATWGAAPLLVAGLAQQPYPHFLVPAAAPLSLAVAALPIRPARPGRRRLAGALSCAAGLGVAGLLARTAGVDWVPQGASQGGNASRTLADYYVGALGVVAGREPLANWRDGFDDRVAADEGAAAWIRGHGLSGHSAVVWSSDAWPYLEAGLPVLLRTAPIYNDEVLLGQGGPVAERVRSLAPDLVLTADDAVGLFPEITPVLTDGYHQVARFGTDTVWVRNDLAPA